MVVGKRVVAQGDAEKLASKGEKGWCVGLVSRHWMAQAASHSDRRSAAVAAGSGAYTDWPNIPCR